MTYPCAYCHKPVVIGRMNYVPSDYAVWGVLSALEQWGTLCDDCYSKEMEAYDHE